MYVPCHPFLFHFVHKTDINLNPILFPSDFLTVSLSAKKKFPFHNYGNIFLTVFLVGFFLKFKTESFSQNIKKQTPSAKEKSCGFFLPIGREMRKKLLICLFFHNFNIFFPLITIISG